MIGGDDYYAELDYIEVMENAKEGYEEEAIIPEEENLSIFQKDNCNTPLCRFSIFVAALVLFAHSQAIFCFLLLTNITHVNIT